MRGNDEEKNLIQENTKTNASANMSGINESNQPLVEKQNFFKCLNISNGPKMPALKVNRTISKSSTISKKSFKEDENEKNSEKSFSKKNSNQNNNKELHFNNDSEDISENEESEKKVQSKKSTLISKDSHSLKLEKNPTLSSKKSKESKGSNNSSNLVSKRSSSSKKSSHHSISKKSKTDSDDSKSNHSGSSKKSASSKNSKNSSKNSNKSSKKSGEEENANADGDGDDLYEKDPEIENRKLYRREKICDTDSEDDGSENEKEVPWVILPDNTFKRIWDLLISGIILYSSIMTPYELAFIDKTKDSWVDTLFDVLLWIDIILTFFSAYTDSEENLVKNHKQIVLSYLKSWFIVDLVSVLPINQMTKRSFSYNKITRISRLPKLYRLVKLTKLLRMTKMTTSGNVNKVTKFFLEKLKINANIERLIFFVMTFLLLNHLCACFWYFMAKIQDLSPDSWVVRLGYVDSSNFELYIISFYWTLTTVTTVGYGDINAGTTIERIYNLFIMSFGVLLYSFAIGSLSSIVSTLDQKTAEMNQKLQILSSIKKEFNLDQNIYDKVRKVIKFDLSRNQKDKMMFLQELPNKLRIELSQIMHDKVIQNLYFFRDQPSDFFAYVAPLLKPVKFSQNDYLYKCQDMIDEMYFVSKGTVIFCLDKKYGEKEIKEVKKNNNFGEIEMCLNEKLTFNIKIKSRNCELFVLKKNDFLRLSVNFKEFIENFLHKSLMRYLKFNEEKNKMIKEFEALMSKCTDNKSLNKSQSPRKDLQAIEEENDDSKEEENSNEEIQEENSAAESKGSEGNDEKKIQKTTTNKSASSNPLNNQPSVSPLKLSRTMNDNTFVKDEEEDKKSKNQANNKFQKKIDKIIEYIDKNNFQFDKNGKNPKELLMQLKNDIDLNEKNNIIEQIEDILKDFYKNNEKSKRSGVSGNNSN